MQHRARFGRNGRFATFVSLAALGIAHLASAQQPAAPPAEVKVTTTLLGGSVYGIDGQGGRAAALVGPEGVFLVDAQFAAVSDKIAAAIKAITPSPIKLLVNTHVHGDHTGGNENFAKLGATIIGRPNLREQLMNPRPGANGQTPPAAPAAALPVLLYDQPLTIRLNGEEAQLIPLQPSHTNGDTAVKFVNADVLMTGDVFRSEGMPNAAAANGGNIVGLLAVIEQFITLAGPNTKVVPGHGPVTNRAALVAHRDMIVTVRDRVAKLKAEGKTLEEVQAAKPTADFDAKVGGQPQAITNFVTALYNAAPAR
jgi:glyoxylase-like metal-dependent hydrolase (beta-lactamase superfamily II)